MEVQQNRPQQRQHPALPVKNKTSDKIMLISLNISGMFNQSSGVSGYCARPVLPYGSSSWEQRGGLGTPWPQNVEKCCCLANLSEKTTCKHFRDWSGISSLSQCQDYYLLGKQSHKGLLSPLQDYLLQPWAGEVLLCTLRIKEGRTRMLILSKGIRRYWYIQTIVIRRVRS